MMPMRRCITCRRSYPQRQLLRFVASRHGRLILDARRTRGGRGVYLCPRGQCFRGLGNLKRKMLSPDVEQLAEQALTQLRELIKELLTQALADGRARWRDDCQVGQDVDLLEPGFAHRLNGLIEQANLLAAEQKVRIGG